MSNPIDFDKLLDKISLEIKCKWCGDTGAEIHMCYKNFIFPSSDGYETQHYSHVCMKHECHKKGRIEGYTSFE